MKKFFVAMAIFASGVASAQDIPLSFKLQNGSVINVASARYVESLTTTSGTQAISVTHQGGNATSYPDAGAATYAAMTGSAEFLKVFHKVNAAGGRNIYVNLQATRSIHCGTGTQVVWENANTSTFNDGCTLVNEVTARSE